MPSMPAALGDAARLAAIQHSGLLDGLPPVAFDRLTRLAARLLGTPLAMVSLLTDERHHVASDVGLGAPWRDRRELPMSHSLCRHVVESGAPLVVDDARAHAVVCESPAIAEFGVAAYLGAPLTLSDGRTLGSFCVVDTTPRAWTPGDLEGLRDLAAVAAAEVEARVRVGEAAEARAALAAADERFRATFEQAAVGIAHVALDGRWVRVNRRLCEVVGYAPAELLARTFQSITHPDDLAADLDLVGRLVVGELPWYRLEKRYLHREGHAVWAMLTVSLVRDAGGRAEYFIAVVEDVSDRKRAEAALRHSQEAVVAAQAETLERLAQAAEVRDDDTGLHTRRVGELSAQLAEALGLSAAEVALVRQAAPLHDVGKIGVPDAVLLKPGRLTAAEFALIQEHAALGARILAGSAAPLTRLAETIAHAHHERWDGGGYPRGLAGEAIPLAARIVAVADVYDALTNARPYRDAWPVDAVVDHIRSRAGTHFDPAVVAAFVRLHAGAGVAAPTVTPAMAPASAPVVAPG